jgi:Adenylate cyclase, family 3 (some proteins contain HAMP domain)
MDNIRVAMNRGAFDFLCKPVNFDDLDITIKKTIQHVAQLRKTLAAIKENNILKMYVDETVLNFMNRREYETSLMVNETIEATIVFVDICSFTTISESEPADTVVRLLNNYFDAMVKEIIKQNGYIDKFIGDAIMAVFRGEFHLDRAIDASLGVRSAIDKLPSFEDGITFLPKVSIGINSGEMISGNIGSANLRRLDYTVVGDVVNSPNGSVCGKGRPDTDHRSGVRKSKRIIQLQRIGEMPLKNKKNPLIIFEVLE